MKRSLLMNIMRALPIALAGLLIFGSCKKDKEEPPKAPEKVFPVPGMGESTQPLQGSTFTLPSNVQVKGEIKGSAFSFPIDIGTSPVVKKSNLKPSDFSIYQGMPFNTLRSADTLDTTYYRGSGNYVSIAIWFENKNSSAVTVELPAGLTFRNVQGTYQNGLLAKKTSFSIPANEVMCVVVNAYCSNLSLHASDEEAVYEIGPVVNIPWLNYIFDKVKNKRINMEEFDWHTDFYNTFTDYINITDKVQSAIWEITDFSGELSQENITELENLPNSR